MALNGVSKLEVPGRYFEMSFTFTVNQNINAAKMEDHLKDYFKSINLETWLKVFSKNVWKRLGFSQKFKNELKTYETTITQNLIFEFLEFAQLTSNPSMRLLEARDENTNGNDVEIFVQQGWVHLVPSPSQKCVSIR